MKKEIAIILIIYLMLGFFIIPISELIHERNPYLDGYLEVNWDKTGTVKPYFTQSYFLHIIFNQIASALIFGVFGALIAYIFIQKRLFKLMYFTIISGVIFSSALFLHNSAIIAKGITYGAGVWIDYFIGTIGTIFTLSFLIYFLMIALENKKAGMPWKLKFFLPIILAPFIGFFSQIGFGYGGYITMPIVVIIYIFILIRFSIKINSEKIAILRL